MNNLFNVYTGNSIPEKSKKIINGCSYIEVPYVISENNGIYTWKKLMFKNSEYTYSSLIDAIIGLSYSLRDTLAIMNNYLDDPENNKYKKEFKELQKVRKAAKEYAKKEFNL